MLKINHLTKSLSDDDFHLIATLKNHYIESFDTIYSAIHKVQNIIDNRKNNKYSYYRLVNNTEKEKRLVILKICPSRTQKVCEIIQKDI